MSRYLVSVELEISEQADGSLVAASSSLPVCIVARDLDELRARMREVSDSVNAFLAAMGEDEAHAFLKERGVKVGGVGKATIEMPVLVGA